MEAWSLAMLAARSSPRSTGHAPGRAECAPGVRDGARESFTRSGGRPRDAQACARVGLGRGQPGQQAVACRHGRVAQPVHCARARVGDCAPVVEHDHLPRHGTDRVHEPSDRVQRDPAAGQDHGSGLECPQCASETLQVNARGQREGAHARTPEQHLQGLRVQGIEIARCRGVEDHHALGSGGRRGKAALGRQPAGGVAPTELVLHGAHVRLGLRADRLEQHLLDRALHGAQAEALLKQPVGGVLVEAGEAPRPAGRRWRVPPRARGPARSPRRRCGSRPG